MSQTLEGLECVNEGCPNIIPSLIISKIRKSNDKRHVCTRCRSSPIPIRIKCLGCGDIFTLTGYNVRMYCLVKCRRDTKRNESK